MKAETRKKLEFLKQLQEMGLSKNDIAELEDRQSLFDQAEKIKEDGKETRDIKEYF